MSVITITKENIKEVLAGEKPVLIQFYAPWCPYCRRIAPVFTEVAEQYADKLTIGQVNIDDSHELEDEYQVELVPTMILLKNGKPVGDVVNPESKEKIENLIRQHI